MKNQKIMMLAGDENVPSMPMSESEVNHMRRLLAWMRCEWMLDEHMIKGYVLGHEESVKNGIITEQEAIESLEKRAEKTNKSVPAYVRQAVKMLTKAIEKHEKSSGIIDNDQ